MDSFVAALADAARTGLMPRGGSILLAVSGGADSTALLHASHALAPRLGWQLCVGHVHHGWRGREADRDQEFVAELSRRLSLPFHCRRGSVPDTAGRLGLSPEAAARHLRYEALAAMAAEAGATIVATAHQHDDVLESLWMARQRRGGPRQLAGPRRSREDGVVRPLLSVTRADILRFLAERRLVFRRDATNGDPRRARTAARRAIAILRASPGGREALAELARQASGFAAERDRLERELEARILPRVRRAGEGVVADAAALQSSPPELLRLALDRLASDLARPGRPPFTGREREQILARLQSGKDFRFEAGRWIRVERRSGSLLLHPRDGAPRVYDFRG
jgi:tRNA(Ile)-lysidine synthase